MGKISPEDTAYLKLALRLAKNGLGKTFPNPMVGAVVVRRGRIVGRGYHRKAGLPHAEIEALRMAGKRAEGATLYVTLEPCSHWGRTPPCVPEIVKAKVARVVCCSQDPNTKVCGRGIRALRRAGIEVSVGALSAEAETLNEGFFSFHKNGRPFVAIKFASSLDGKIAARSGDSRWITNEEAREYARKLRRNYQAILVGINTVLHDDPHLGLRIKSVPDPLRIILDSTLRIPLGCKVLRDNNVVIFTTRRANKKKRKELMGKGISVVVCPGDVISLPFVMKELARREIISVFVEGGGEVLGSFVDEKLVDKVYAFHAPILIGGETAVSAVSGKGAGSIRESLRLKNVVRKTFGDNILISGYIDNGKGK
ncbi:MAG: bifunctional diaminohydroxyphosphoribosylaminopyrimidine deaminase/5-amino-6-(5-phosphoribosylamino)uracil reductase RibD [Candidatus Kaiserbacteria bacterium]|nr:bifunctional diaminohydroxyphosphoribosylaminopyrimidine deaminase/5-amino-6-(5-phosphoribosylamino)uracil reductase RibD [Candidatus Kaiserbacteria bacterium]